MSASEPMAPAARRPLRKRTMHAVRRAHMYFGLFLLPWAVLYGATGFLFNHPTAFADAPTTSFGKNELVGTPMESLPKPDAVAAQVLAMLRSWGADARDYVLVEPEKARYTRDFAFATVKAGDTEVSLLFDVNNPGGTVRSRVPAPPKPTEHAPFAFGPRAEKAAPLIGERFTVPDPLHERVKTAVPVVLERTGFPTGEVTVTSVPDLAFHASDGTTTWRITYNALAGTVSGAPVESTPPPKELSTRRFFTNMHLTSGFPGNRSTGWFWAVVVDAMAFVMVFWGVSGLFMWWQIKAARRWGLLVLLLSGIAATVLGLGMHELLAPR